MRSWTLLKANFLLPMFFSTFSILQPSLTENSKSDSDAVHFPVFPVCAALLVFCQQYNEAEDEPKNQEVRGHQKKGHWVKVPSGGFGGQTLWEF